MRKGLLAFLAVLLLVSVGWSGSTTATAAGPETNNLIIGSDQQPSNLNPWEGSADTKENVLALLFLGLTYIDQTGTLRPGLATEIPTEANGRVRIETDADGNVVSQEVDWTIRDDATWSDGVDITCADVLFTHEVQSRTDVLLSSTAFSSLVESVECANGEGGKDFTITYNSPNLFFDSIAGNIGLSRFYDIAPKHIWEQHVENISAPEDYLGVPPATGTDPAQVVGSGPFRLVEWNIDQFMTLERREDYFMSPPGDPANYIQEVTIRFISDGPTILSALFAGELDATDDIALAGQDPDVIQNNLGDTGTVEGTASGFIEKLNFNLFEDPNGLGGQYPDQVNCQIADDLLLWDKRTRQAIAYGVDRASLAPAVFPGATASNSFVVRGDLGFNNSLEQYEFDPAAATALLTELGWEDTDDDGFLERTTDDGQEVQFDLPWVSTDIGFRIQTGQVLQQDLADIGINLQVENLPATVVFSSEFISHGSDCVWGGIIEYAEAGGIGQAPADPLSNELFAFDRNNDPLSAFPDNAPLAGNSFTGTDITGWTHEEFENLRAQAVSEFDSAARAAIVEQMQVIYNEELPTVPLYDRVENVAIKNGLVNYRKGSAAARTQYVAAWCWGWTQNGAVEAVC